MSQVADDGAGDIGFDTSLLKKAKTPPRRNSKKPNAASPGGRQGIDAATGKASKGLRHFSMKVCKKVEEKGKTSYNEVADELVQEFMEQKVTSDQVGGGKPVTDEKGSKKR